MATASLVLAVSGAIRNAAASSAAANFAACSTTAACHARSPYTEVSGHALPGSKSSSAGRPRNATPGPLHNAVNTALIGTATPGRPNAAVHRNCCACNDAVALADATTASSTPAGGITSPASCAAANAASSGPASAGGQDGNAATTSATEGGAAGREAVSQLHIPDRPRTLDLPPTRFV